MAHDVMISYLTKDKHVADAVCSKLENSGIRCWITPRDVMPGSNWAESIYHAITESRVMVLIFSSNTNESSQIIAREVNIAIQKEVCIIPFRIENVLPSGDLALYLGVTHWLDALTPPMEKHLQSLADTVKTFLGQKKPEIIYSPSEEITKKKRIKTKGFNKLIFIGGVLTALTIAFTVSVFVKENWHYGRSKNTKQSISPSPVASSNEKMTAITPSPVTPTILDKSNPAPKNVKAGYRVGLVSFGVSVDEFERVRKEILAEGYRQHDNNVHLTQRTSWLAKRPTVIYYDRRLESVAKMLAEKMEKLTGLKFSIQRGAGLGVTKGEEFSTLFIHYMRERE